MDFWSRLVGSVGGTSSTKQPLVKNPHQRLDRFKKVHKQLLIWYKDLSEKAICNNIEALNRILEDEIRSPAPHLCVVYVVSSQVYDVVAAIVHTSSSEKTIHGALKFFNFLIDNEEGALVENEGFANAVIKFIDRISSTGFSSTSAQMEGSVAEILFGITAKVRLQPEILPVWFRPRSEAGTSIPFEISISSNPNRREFPLFYMLIEYVHLDGRVGDFARTGLLYLLGSSAQAEELERWIVESDLPAMMVSGLGALYSRLSRKLVFSFAEESIPPITSFSVIQKSSSAFDVEVTGSSEFQTVLGTFLSYIVFWQDVLEQCPSNDIELTLLDHFKVLFLQQLLYPSLVESSDADGGSSVAVLTYLRSILESIHYPRLIRLIMQYLLGLPEPEADDSNVSRPTTLARRRKSYTLRRDLAREEEKPSPELFTLVDLILTSLQSRNQQTITATLRLCSTIFSKQHLYAIPTLVKVCKPEATDYRRPLKTHNLQVDTLLLMAEDLATNDELEESYESHLEDVQTLLETHCCAAELLALPGMNVSLSCEAKVEHTTPGSGAAGYHAIDTDDPLLPRLLHLLKNFLANDIETNLSLTQVFVVLASCGNTSIEGWLIGGTGQECCSSNQDDHPAKNTDEDMEESSTATSGNQSGSFNSSGPASLIFAALESLVEQVDSFRQKIQEFDIHLAERRRTINVGEEKESTSAGISAPSRASEDSNSPSIQQPQKSSHIVSFPQKFLSETTSSNVSRASSPRGRWRDDPPSALAKKLGYLQISPSPSPSKGLPRTTSASPLRRNLSPTRSKPSNRKPPIKASNALFQKITVSAAHPSRAANTALQDATDSESSSSVHRESVEQAEQDMEEEVREISLGHLLTNVIVLQEFILELAALIEVRASLFGELG